MFTVRRAAALASVVVALAAAAGTARASRPPVRSMLELRKDGVVQQQWDLSCGAAALSTLLTHELGDPVSEPEVVTALLALADPERIRRDGGFTMLDLKRYAIARGYDAKGYASLSLPALASLAPAIVATVVRGQPHFMVFRGVAGGRVVVSDPAYGHRVMTPDQFEAVWSPRVAFVVRRPGAEPVRAPPSATVVPDPVIRGIGRWTP